MSYDLLKSALSNIISLKNNSNNGSNVANDYITSAKFIKTAKDLAPTFGVNIDTEEFNLFLKDTIDEFKINMEEGESLVNFDDYEHDSQWVYKSDIEPYYSSVYENLISNTFPPKVTKTIMQNSLNILSSLGNPKNSSSWDRRGLIFGHVQSGKTSNFIGVIAKAADAGYRMIIVLTTNDEKLRKQTQERIDEGFIGYKTGNDKRIRDGVGKLKKDYKQPINLTTTKSDGIINPMTSTNITPDVIEDRPWVVVMKKEKRRLEGLHKYLMQDAVNNKIQQMPVLLIDDEADWASVNSKKDEDSPTLINQCIRQILALYNKSSYVGVTATPFANIFINHKSYTEMLEDDLFPRDMIYSLEAPENYIGGDKIFLDAEVSDRAIEHVNDAEDFFPTKRKIIPLEGIPKSLINAFHEFIIVRCIRNIRGDRNKHCTMMINASVYVDTTKRIFDEISDYYDLLKPAVMNNYMMEDDYAMKNLIMSQIKETFVRIFSSNIKESWDQIKPELYNVISEMRLFAEYNGSPNGGLDYDSYTMEGIGVTAVVVGGFKLSRGLTLEGLTVSYLYRNSLYGDTLLQLGRFFGYRPNYDDIIRVYIRETARVHFNDIFDEVEKLRMQIKEMINERKTPKEFGLYMFNNYSDKFKVSSPSKMRSAVNKKIQIGFAGQSSYGNFITMNEKDKKENDNLIVNFMDKYQSKIEDPKRNGARVIRSINTESIIKLLNSYKFIKANKSKFDNLCQYLEQKIKLHEMSDVIFDCNVGDISITGIPFKFGYAPRNTWMFYEKEEYWVAPNSKISTANSLVTLAQPADIQKLRQSFPNVENDNFFNRHYQSVFKRPVLLIIPAEVTNKERNKHDKIFGLEFYYPSHIGRNETITVSTNTVFQDDLFDFTDNILDDEIYG